MNWLRRLLGKTSCIESEAIVRSKCKAVLEQLAGQLHELDGNLTVEALGALETHKLDRVYEAICQQLETLLDKADSMPVDYVVAESKRLASQTESLVNRMDKLQIFTD